MLKVLNERWHIFSQILLDVQAWGFTVVFYFTIMIPFGIGMRLFGDPLATKGTPEWVKREPVSSEMEIARRQG